MCTRSVPVQVPGHITGYSKQLVCISSGTRTCTCIRVLVYNFSCYYFLPRQINLIIQPLKIDWLVISCNSRKMLTIFSALTIRRTTTSKDQKSKRRENMLRLTVSCRSHIVQYLMSKKISNSLISKDSNKIYFLIIR